MNKEEVIEWIENLPVQTLTDELKDDIISMIDHIEEKAISFALFASKWSANNTSFEFYELDKEIQNKIYQKFITGAKDE